MNSLPPEYVEAKDNALEALEHSDPTLAFTLIRSFINYPVKIKDDEMWRDIFTLFKRIASPVLGESIDVTIQAVIDTPDDVDSLYDLAYAIYEQHLNGVAATLLRRALNLDPSNVRIITELSANLEALMYYEDAYQMLINSRENFGKDSLCLYLLGFNAIMTGRLAVAESILPIIEDDPDDTIHHMYKMLRGMVNRALALTETRALDEKDLRGWHMAINGSILLHLSPYGFEDGMYGRYAYASDNYPLIKDGILRIRKILECTNIEIDAIVPLPDRGSRAIGIATSKILDIPLIEWDEFDENTSVLIIAYDLYNVEDPDIVSRLHSHHPKQILWAHATCWTDAFPYAADITTFLYQEMVAPWDRQLSYIDDSVQMSPADESSDEKLAEKIVAAELAEVYFDDADDIISLLEPMKTLDDPDKPGIFQTTGKRLKLREGSPVRSNRFM